MRARLTAGWWRLLGLSLPFTLAVAAQEPAAGAQEAAPSVARGEYVLRAAGGCSCHTNVAEDGAFMAGGRPVQTPFGAIYATNITPDVETGIGAWTDDDFIAAMRRGVDPEGRHLFPAFPYTSFTHMSDRDLLDLKAYLFTLPAVAMTAPPPDLPPPFRWRAGLAVWKALFLDEGPWQPQPDSSAAWNRGAYLVTALGHCAECHTSRNLLGGLQRDRAFAGTRDGPEGETAPNITPDDETGVGRWSAADMVWYLQMGLLPDGDSAQGTMLEVIDNGYSHLSEDDLRAIARYLRSLAPVRNAARAGED